MMHRLCSSGQMLAYGWGRNAPPLALPPGVGFEIGAGSGFTHAVLEARHGFHFSLIRRTIQLTLAS